MSLFAQAQAGAPDALAALTRQHLPLVQALARRFPDSEDAFQQGCIGLIKAIRGYREDAGFQFSTYAVPCILGEMRRAQNASLGWRARASLKKILAFQEMEMKVNGRSPGIQEISAHTGVAPEEIALLLEQGKGPVYDETGSLFSMLPDPGGDRWLLDLCIRDILSRMPEEESWLLRQRFLCGKSQLELAQALSTTQSRISRYEKKARLHFQNAWNESVLS